MREGIVPIALKDKLAVLEVFNEESLKRSEGGICGIKIVEAENVFLVYKLRAEIAVGELGVKLACLVVIGSADENCKFVGIVAFVMRDKVGRDRGHHTRNLFEYVSYADVEIKLTASGVFRANYLALILTVGKYPELAVVVFRGL